MPGFTRLEAVNRMLEASGEQPVNTLLSDGVNDTDLAQSILDTTIIEVLSQGWSFNTRYKKLYRDSDQKIVLSDNILHFTPWGEHLYCSLSQLGNYLYDNYNDRDTFPDDEYVELKLIYKWDYDDIPTDVQLFIADKAARDYQMKTQRSREADAYLAETLFMSQARARASDLRTRNSNVNRNGYGNQWNQTSRNRYGLRGYF